MKIVGLADGKLSHGLLVLLSLEMTRRNPYHLIFGPTDTQGKLSISKQAMETEAQRTRDMFPMDYESLTCFAGDIIVGAMSQGDLDAALRACDLYNGFAGYPPDYRARLVAARSRLADLRPSRLDVRATVQPRTAKVRVSTRSVIDSQAESA